jgi:hypothetical protein
MDPTWDRARLRPTATHSCVYRRPRGSTYLAPVNNSQEAAKRLHADIRSHSQRIEELRGLIKAAEDEIAIHETVLMLAQDDRIISAVAELDPGTTDLGEQGASLEKHLVARNISIPPGVTFIAGAAGEEARFFRVGIQRGDAAMQVTWVPEIGFVGHGLVPQLSFLINSPSQ